MHRQEKSRLSRSSQGVTSQSCSTEVYKPFPTTSTAPHQQQHHQYNAMLPSSERTSSTSCPLLSVLAWSVTLLLLTSCLGIADAGVLMGHPLGKRSFLDIQCKGVYDKSLFARLDRICEDCYNLFREPQLHSLCRYIKSLFWKWKNFIIHIRVFFFMIFFLFGWFGKSTRVRSASVIEATLCTFAFNYY